MARLSDWMGEWPDWGHGRIGPLDPPLDNDDDDEQEECL